MATRQEIVGVAKMIQRLAERKDSLEKQRRIAIATGADASVAPLTRGIDEIDLAIQIVREEINRA